MIVFVPAIYGGLKQFDSVVMPVYEELVRRGVEVKWGSWNDFRINSGESIRTVGEKEFLEKWYK